MHYTTISFPGLGLEMDPISYFQLGPLKIHLYGIIIATGLVLAAVYAMRRSKEFGLKQDDLLDGILWVTPFAIICARAYYCIFSWHEFADDPISVLYIWHGGLAIYGGVIGAIIGSAVFCRIRKIKYTTVLDLVLMGFLLGQAIGRWGNFFNREAFGAPTECFLRMGLMDPATGEFTYYHPTFLYESVWNLTGFVLLHFLSKKRRYDGQMALCYAMWYGLGRTFVEGLRMDSLWWGPFRVSQLLAAISCIAAAAVLTVQLFRPHDPKKLFVNQIKAQTENTPENVPESTPKDAPESTSDKDPE